MRVGYFPYNPGGNPYQRLFAEALEAVGVDIVRIPSRKLFPLSYALSRDIELLQLDWPDDFYRGRNAWTRRVKQFMYLRGLQKARSVPLVWTAHNLHAHNAKDIAYERRMLQELIGVCDGILVMSKAAEQQLREEYRIQQDTRVEVVYHGHYMDAYPNNVTRETARENLGIPLDSRVALFLGRIQPYKDCEQLVASFARAATSRDYLLIAGEPSTRDYLKQLTSQIEQHVAAGVQVRLEPEFISDDRLQYYYNAADIVVLPYRKILSSGSLLAAMSFGACVVAPRLGSIPEVVCPETSVLYDPSDPAALEAALRSALNRNDLQQCRQTCRRFTQARYAWSTTAQTVKELYRTILDR